MGYSVHCRKFKEVINKRMSCCENNVHNDPRLKEMDPMPFLDPPGV